MVDNTMARPNIPLQPQRSQAPPIHTNTSGAAVTSLVIGLLGFCVPFLSLVGIICGHVGLSNIKRANGWLTGRGMAISGLIIGYLAFLGWTTYAVGMYYMIKHLDSGAYEQLAVEAVPVPSFPSLPEFETLQPSGVKVGQIQLSGSGPGANMQMRIYLPAGDNLRPGSLICVLTAPAGTNLLQGSNIGELDEDAYHDESLPYAEAGMAVVMYSIDGSVSDSLAMSDEEEADDMIRAYKEFKAAQAGVVNGRNALEFALAEIPMVDPSRIFSAGHSSAGTLSLLMGVREPRLRGCIAYAPCGDVKAFHKDLTSDPGIGLFLPGISRFLRQSSPASHLDKLDLPVFLFQAKDDGIVSYADGKTFYEKAVGDAAEAGLLKSKIVFKEVPDGGHYDSMIEEGIPAGISWIRQQ